ncbi:MAG TPA: TetR/AcrR family transcriptional regulator [Gammaproteobacteria bacterium]|nr:TetR/AcrR family transcriptional regulator [Gammaproteobacteria bacterium]
MSAVKSTVRAEAQRERILTAARKCFIEHGFHAASMASIAETADISIGLIYRYFEGKNEIIVAIIEQQLTLLRADLALLDNSVDLAARLAEGCGTCGTNPARRLSPALFLEMSAEATRDPKIAAALNAFDGAVRGDIAAWMSRGKDQGGYGQPETLSPARALLLQCLIDGLKVRAAREPELDKILLKQALDEILPAVLESPV